MATSTYILPLSKNDGTKLTGFGGCVYLVPSSDAVNNSMPMLEDTTRPGQYYRENVPDGEYKIYIDTDKSGTPVEGDLYKRSDGTAYKLWIGESKVTTVTNKFDASGNPTTAHCEELANSMREATSSTKGLMSSTDKGLYDKIALNFDSNIRLKARATDFIKSGKNLFNKNNIGNLAGNYISYTTGIPTPNASYTATHFIPVLPSTQYARSWAHQTAFYDSNKTYISGLDSQSLTFTTPVSCAFVRLTTYNVNTFQVELGSAPTAYEEFTTYLDKTMVKLEDDSVGKANLCGDIAGDGLVQNTDGSIKVADNIRKTANQFDSDNLLREIALREVSLPITKLKNAKVGKNLFDKSAAILGYYVYEPNGSLAANANYYASDYIPVSENMAYTVKNANQLAFYDLTKEYISGDYGNNNSAKTVITPTGCCYIRISTAKACIDTQQVEKGSSSTDYEKFSYTLEGANVDDIALSVDAQKVISETKSLHSTIVNDLNGGTPTYIDDVFLKGSGMYLSDSFRGWGYTAQWSEDKVINIAKLYGANKLNLAEYVVLEIVNWTTNTIVYGTAQISVSDWNNSCDSGDPIYAVFAQSITIPANTKVGVGFKALYNNGQDYEPVGYITGLSSGSIASPYIERIYITNTGTTWNLPIPGNLPYIVLGSCVEALHINTFSIYQSQIKNISVLIADIESKVVADIESKVVADIESKVVADIEPKVVADIVGERAISMPKKIYLLDNYENSIYFKAIAKRFLPDMQPVRIEGGQFVNRMDFARVEAKTLSAYTGVSAKVYDININPKEEVLFNIAVGLQATNNGALTIVSIGDSLTYNGSYLKRARELCPALTFTGIRVPYGDATIKDEGRGGWTLQAYFTNLHRTSDSFSPFMQPATAQKYYGNTDFWKKVVNGDTSYGYNGFSAKATEIGFDASTGLKSSPSVNDCMYNDTDGKYQFWDGASWSTITEAALSFSFNFAKYRAVWNVSQPNIVTVMLGTNDFRSSSPATVDGAFLNFKTYMDNMISSIKSDSASIKIAILIPPSVTGSADNVDGAFALLNDAAMWEARKNFIKYYDQRESENIFLVDVGSSLDPVYGMLKVNEKPFSDYSGLLNRVVDNNTPHPSTDGYYQMGVRLAGFIQCIR